MSDRSELEALREEVREVTNEIIRLTGLRFSLTKEIDRIKRSIKLPVVDYKVERDLKSSIIDACNKYNVDEHFGLRLLNLLIDEAVRMQKGMDKHTKAISVIDMFVLAKKMEREGSSVIHLEVGEPDFGPPEKVKRTTYDSIERGFTHYTEPAGIPDLRGEIANSVNKRFQINISPEQVAVTCGGRFSVYASILSTLFSGDEAVVIQPAWPAYVDCIEDVGSRAVVFKTKLEDGWRPDVESFSELLNDSTKLIVLNYPNNPTGKVLEKHDLKAIVELAKERDITILSDEVYLDYAFKPYNSILEFHDCKSIYVSSFSKSYGMTGFRIGYAVSDLETIKKISRIQALASTSVPEFIQYAAIEALRCEDNVKVYSNLIKRRIKLICKELKKMEIPYYEPDGTFYAFPQISQDIDFDIEKFSLDLLREKGVCVAPGTTFGDYPNFVRISACQNEHIISEGLRRIGEVLI